MRTSTFIGFCFLGTVGLASIGCSSDSGATVRNVSGTLNPSDKITKVVAVQASKTSTQSYSATVDASGHFSLALPIGERFVVAFLSGNQAVGVLQFKNAQTGKFTTLLPVTHAPTASPSNTKPADAAAEVESKDIELGAVDNPANDNKYEPANDPEEQVDSDDDGQDDATDTDDDNDGKADAEDDDNDNDGVADDEETHDGDGDGVPDEVEHEGSDGA